MHRQVLLIQNDASNAETVREALTHSPDQCFQMEWLRTCAQGLERLAKTGSADIGAVLLDLSLADCQGIDAFERILAVAPQIPILILCDVQNEDLARLAVQRGAQDYLLMSRLDSYQLPKSVSTMLERAANSEALFEAKERAQVTLESIGDAVISSDLSGKVTFLNAAAEKLTGWSQQEAAGQPIDTVMRIVDAETHQLGQHPMAVAMRDNKTVTLTPNCVLVRRDGRESGIEDSAAPIHDRWGHVTGAVMVFHDVSSVRALSARMAYLAQHDSLTDLPNRLLLCDRLGQAIAMAHRHRKCMAVLCLDVDRFKHINDSLGHAVGDRLLQTISERLRATVRKSDTVSRQGGDEFIIVLSEVTSADDGAICAEKIIEELSKPHCVDHHDLHITVSIGIVTFPNDGQDPETLLKNADVAMYHAKDAGRNNFKFFTEEMNVRAKERQAIENGLREAIERQQFVLHFQPKIQLETGAVVGAEALIRWRHPQRGLVPPTQFIAVAEESGLIVPIGRWVLREACRQARAWQDAGLPPLRIAVNTSTVELRVTDFASEVQQILSETGLDSRYLEMELTETFLSQDFSSTASVLNSLKRMGVHITLDDFGTGYSSLSDLKRFPIDSLKIDRSFITDVTANGSDASIVSAVLSMGESLGIHVIAEGIESLAQLVALQEQGCREGQGFYFSRPVVADEFVKLLKRSSGEQTAANCMRNLSTAFATLD